MKIRVVLVDDQELIRLGFRMVLESREDTEVVGEAENGAAALTLLQTVQADVVLMDVRMPQMNGTEATRLIRAGPNPPRVLILTTFDLDEYVYEALQAGASGFLLKDSPVDEIVAAIKHVYNGDAVVAPSTTKRLLEHFTQAKPRLRADASSSLEELTPREREVLELIARGLSNAEIALQLGLSEGTVKVHVGHILSKLELRDRVQAVVLAYESGLVHPGKG